MYRYVIKRLLMLVLVILGVSLLIYSIMDLAPGDPVVQELGTDATPEEYAAMRIEMGLDKPLLVRYAKYMWGLLHGDLGYSYKYNMDVMDLYLQRLPATLTLASTATLLSIIISIPLGIYCALHQGSIQDNLASVLSLFGLAAPLYWVGLMLIMLFSLRLGWFNSGGFSSWKDVVLPASALALQHAAMKTRTTRSSMLDVLRQDYLMLARAKGVSEQKVITKHALKNALIPILTVIGIQFTGSLGGSVVTETVFSWPGVGRLVVDAIKSQDVNTVTGSIIMMAIITSVILLLIDLLYAYVDPRIKAQYSK